MNDEPLLKMPPEWTEAASYDRMAKNFKSEPKRKPSVEKLTARQQFILELLKAQIQANGGLSDQSVKMAIKATDQIFGALQ